MKKIDVSCCAVGIACEEVHVLKSNCPIQREVGQRIVKGREECTCVYQSVYTSLGVEPCKYYRGVTKTKKGYMVKCLESEKGEGKDE